MEYELTIHRRELNPDYKPSRSGDPYWNNGPPQYVPTTERVLTVVLTEAEYEAVKRGVLETFK